MVPRTVTPRLSLRSAAAVAVALVSASCIADRAAAPARQPPKLEFTETTHGLGRVDAGELARHSYAFRNTGGLDLSIDNVRAACSCTAAAVPARVIPPGGDGVIDVTFDATHERGPVTRTITVYSNDPARPVTTLTLVADVDAVVAADPPALYVGHVRRGESAPNPVRLLGAVGTVGPVEGTGPVLDATVNGVVSERSPATLRVSVKPQAPLGRFKESVLVHTRDARQPQLAIPVVGVVDAEAAATAPR
jgi:hypothetical protein